MKKEKIIGIIVGVIIFIAIIVGMTYAWFVWQSDETNIGGTTTFFDVDYTNGAAINNSELVSSTDKSGGASTEVVIRKKSGSIDGIATLTLNITTLTQDADSLAEYGEVDFSAIKWEVYKSTNFESPWTYLNTPSYSGTLQGKGTTTGTSITLFDNETLNSSYTAYKIYIWANAEESTNGYIGTNLVSHITASAVQETPNQ